MNRHTLIPATLCAAALAVPLSACSSTPPLGQGLATSTRDNALSAMHGEASAHAKYTAYAEQARATGQTQAASAFESAAETELSDHFAREADLLGLGAGASANLREAISAESAEMNNLYPGYAKQALVDADPDAAQLFTRIGVDEAAHIRDFTTALTSVTSHGVGVAIPAGPAVTAVAVTAGPPRASGTTLANLRAAMTGEAYTAAKYQRYADQARRDGNPQLAQLFSAVAQQELGDHFTAAATLAGLVAVDTRANLVEAAAGEQHEADVMYPDYARQATAAGDTHAAALFTEIAADEKTHQAAFDAAARP